MNRRLEQCTLNQQVPPQQAKLLMRHNETGEGSSSRMWQSSGQGEEVPEDVNYVVNQGRQGNFHNYHPGMRNQQNYGWKNTQCPNQFQNQNMGASSLGFVPRPHQQQVPPPPQENKKPSLEEMFQMYMASKEKVIQQQQTLLQSHGSTLQ